MKVGFAGIGTMGQGMAKNLVKAGFDVHVYNRTEAKARGIAGALVVEDPAGLEVCDVIFTCVSNDGALKDVLGSGIFDILDKNKVLVDCGTTSIGLTLDVASKCSEKGAGFLDAPVTGSKKGADEGTLMFMVGGDEVMLEKCRPAFQAMGSRIVHCGPISYGQKIKLALNLTMAMMLESYLEGTAFALKQGVPMDVIQQVFENSGARSGVSTFKLQGILNRDFNNPQFLLSLMHKDLGLVQNEFQRYGLALPNSAATTEVFKRCMELGLGDEDFSAIVKLVEQTSGVRIEKTKF